MGYSKSGSQNRLDTQSSMLRQRLLSPSGQTTQGRAVQRFPGGTTGSSARLRSNNPPNALRGMTSSQLRSRTSASSLPPRQNNIGNSRGSFTRGIPPGTSQRGTYQRGSSFQPGGGFQSGGNAFRSGGSGFQQGSNLIRGAKPANRKRK